MRNEGFGGAGFGVGITGIQSTLIRRDGGLDFMAGDEVMDGRKRAKREKEEGKCTAAQS